MNGDIHLNLIKNRKMKRKYYFKPQITINVIDADYVMRAHSWSSGNDDNFPVVPGLWTRRCQEAHIF
jgi:hypothetical protein